MNFFSKDQDVQLGQEAAAEVRKQVTVVQNPFLQEYIQRIGKRLTAQPEAGDWPFNFTVILDPNINAFALPGGPMFVNSGTIANAENEAQIAGVMGHEMSHVILRHGTKQASKGQPPADPGDAGQRRGRRRLLAGRTDASSESGWERIPFC